MAVSAFPFRATFSLAFPIKVLSFLLWYRKSVDCHAVGAARDRHVVAAGGAVVVAASQVQLATRGADAPVVEPQEGGAATHAEPRGYPFGAADGDVAGAAEDGHGQGARGGGEHHLQATGATIDAEGTEPEFAQVGDQPRGAAADLDVPGDARVERDLCRAPRPAVEPVAGRSPWVPDGNDASPHPYHRHLVPEARAAQAPHARVGQDGDPMGAVREPQATAPRGTER